MNRLDAQVENGEIARAIASTLSRKFSVDVRDFNLVSETRDGKRVIVNTTDCRIVNTNESAAKLLEAYEILSQVRA